MTEKRAGAVTFRGNPMTLLGPKLAPGDKAPTFKTLNNSLATVTLADTPAKPRLFSALPSLDTPVCSRQTKLFEEELAKLGDKVAAYTVSLDLPFAQKRFCGSENLTNMQTLSDVHDGSFGTAFGVRIDGLPLAILSRAVFVVDKDGTVTYAEYVPEVGADANTEAALAALKALV